LDIRDIGVATTVAALYAVVTVALGDLSFSWLQVRVSDALLPLSYLFGWGSVIGVTVGCLIANLFSPVGLIDVVVGPLLNFLAALLSYKYSFKNRVLACIYPVLVVSIGVSTYLHTFYGVPYLLTVFTIAVGETVSSMLIGYPLLLALEKRLKTGVG